MLAILSYLATLRHKHLSDPNSDWSTTKHILVFGGAIVLCIGACMYSIDNLGMVWTLIFGVPIIFVFFYSDWLHYQWHLENPISKYIIANHMPDVTGWRSFDKELKKNGTYVNDSGIYSIYQYQAIRTDWRQINKVTTYYDYKATRSELLNIELKGMGMWTLKDSDRLFHQFMKIMMKKYPEVKEQWEDRNIMDGEVVAYEKK
ncbi:MAG: hypothetical protein JKY84_15080 [Emcibacteraceae bacterium]|nr:hypothetical protein [Emcibacteraceae bacterium]